MSEASAETTMKNEPKSMFEVLKEIQQDERCGGYKAGRKSVKLTLQQFQDLRKAGLI